MLVKQLNERYLRVDAICIMQDDLEDKMAQIQNMDQVYSNTVVSLITAEGSDANAGLPGEGASSRAYK